jgi:hypothetical protein
LSVETQRSPDLRDLFRQSSGNISAAIRACAPGTVIKVWPGDLVDVKLTVNELDADDNPEALPTLRKVPLFNFGNARIYTRYPVLLGDPVLCMFGDVDLDSWKGTRGLKVVDAGSDRRHDLSDCMAMPIGWGQTPPGLEVLGFLLEYIGVVKGLVTVHPSGTLDPATITLLTALEARLNAAGVK